MSPLSPSAVVSRHPVPVHGAGCRDRDPAEKLAVVHRQSLQEEDPRSEMIGSLTSRLMNEYRPVHSIVRPVADRHKPRAGFPVANMSRQEVVDGERPEANPSSREGGMPIINK